MKSKRVSKLYRWLFGGAGLALAALALSNHIAHDINAFYFPDRPNLAKNWYTWGFGISALLCLVEAVFAVSRAYLRKA